MNVFDNYAEKYDSWYDRNPEIFSKEINCLKKVAGKFEFALEIGVGSGRFAEALGIEIGIDISKAMLKLAAKRGIEVVRADAKLLPFKRETFDMALLAFTICFVDDPWHTIKEASRVIKRNGKIVICGVDKNSKLAEEYRSKDSPFYKVARFYTIQEIEEMLRKAGLKISAIDFIDIKYGKDVFCLSATFN